MIIRHFCKEHTVGSDAMYLIIFYITTLVTKFTIHAAAPAVWNSLLANVIRPCTMYCFVFHQLKTFYFNSAFNLYLFRPPGDYARARTFNLTVSFMTTI